MIQTKEEFVTNFLAWAKRKKQMRRAQRRMPKSLLLPIIEVEPKAEELAEVEDEYAKG